MPRVGHHSVAVVGYPYRLAIYSVRRLSPRKWEFTVHIDEVSATKAPEERIDAIRKQAPATLPIVVVSCSAAKSAVTAVLEVFADQERMVEEGKIDSYSMKPGQIVRIEEGGF